MQAGPDPLGGSSFTARKFAASHLPSFELPPPPISTLPHKYQPYNQIAGLQCSGSGSASGVGQLLTPPNTIPDASLSPVSSGTTPSNGTSSQQQNAYSQNGYWPQASQAPAQYQQQPQTSSWMPSRGLFSPSSLNSIVRGNEQTQSRDGAAQQESYQLPPFPSMSMSISLPAMAAAGQVPLNSGYLSAQVSGSGSGSYPSSNQHDPFGRLPPTPSSYYSQPQTSSPNTSQMGFSFNSQHSSNQHHRGSPPGSAELPSMQTTSQSPQPYQRPYGQYPLPSVNGPVMTNLHQPNAHMALVGGMQPSMAHQYSNGGVGDMQHLYGMSQHQPHAPMPPQERPFKCDQCMQSFNRNHDLKRHKRIHLAVKPYPCGHCEKSFSRKDALKRHILVKGCGKAHGMRNESQDGSSSAESSPADVKSTLNGMNGM